MPVPAFEDLSEFFDLDEFAISCVSGATTFKAFFNAPNRLIDTLAEIDISTGQTTLFAIEADVVNVAKNDTITADGKNYRLKDKQASGTGTIVLVLDRL